VIQVQNQIGLSTDAEVPTPTSFSVAKFPTYSRIDLDED